MTHTDSIIVLSILGALIFAGLFLAGGWWK